MSNRARRRYDAREFRHQVRGHVLTHLIDADADLSTHPMLNNIARVWRAAIPQRKPFCFCCRSKFAQGAQVGAYLFAQPSDAADVASVSVMCVECWRDLADADVDRAAETVLSALIPGGRLAPLEPTVRNVAAPGSKSEKENRDQKRQTAAKAAGGSTGAA